MNNRAGGDGFETSVCVFRDEMGRKRINHYLVLETLGYGQHSKVKLARNLVKGELCAVKIVRKKSIQKRNFVLGPEERMTLHNEADVMCRLCHHNVVGFHELIDDPACAKMYLVLEYASRGPVMKEGDFVQRPEDDVRRLFGGLLDGLQHVHDHGLIHRDIKPENLFLAADGTLKLGDFSVARIVGDDDTVKKTMGTLAFLPPEACRGGRPYAGRPADVWAVGVTLYVLLFQGYPFWGEGIVELSRSIHEDVLTFPRPLTPELADLFSRLLDRNPMTRMTVKEARNHPWTRGESACTRETLH